VESHGIGNDVAQLRFLAENESCGWHTMHKWKSTHFKCVRLPYYAVGAGGNDVILNVERGVATEKIHHLTEHIRALLEGVDSDCATILSGER
jgi:hypothetical protein